VSSDQVPFQPSINVTSHKRSATDAFSLLQDIFWVINDPGQRPTDSRIVTHSVFLFINYQCEK
jgi:archaellum component FlaG (FlaF/FlaG flagellin family)